MVCYVNLVFIKSNISLLYVSESSDNQIQKINRLLLGQSRSDFANNVYYTYILC